MPRRMGWSPSSSPPGAGANGVASRCATRRRICPSGMHPDLADRLACPSTGTTLRLAAGDVRDDGHVTQGLLEAGAGASYPITGGIPRFVSFESYTSTFGVQWRRWATTQLDSVNGT